MFRIGVAIILFLGAHFSATFLVPAEDGKAMPYWPFAKDSTASITAIGAHPGAVPAVIFADVAAAAYILSLLALFGWFVPQPWGAPLAVVGAIASAILFVGYLGPLAIIPLAVDAIVLYGVVALGWTPATFAR